MNESNVLDGINKKLLPSGYTGSALDTIRTREKIFRILLNEVRIKTHFIHTYNLLFDQIRNEFLLN